MMNSEGKAIPNIQDPINLQAIMLFLKRMLKKFALTIDNKKKEASLVGTIQNIKDSIRLKM